MRTYPFYKNNKGVTLVELVIFIVIIAISVTGIMLVIVTTSKQSADPMIRIRTVELGQALMEEILLRAYDENTPPGGSCVRFPAGSSRCTDGPNAAAQNQAAFGTDGGETRAVFDDVDDYHNQAYCGDGASLPAGSACTGACQTLVNESGDGISSEYAGFSICIRLAFAGGDFAATPGPVVSVNAQDAKRIEVEITDPLDSKMNFSAYRLNF